MDEMINTNENNELNSQKRLRDLLIILIVLIIVLIAAFFSVTLIRFYWFRPISISGHSMEPTFKDESVVNINTLADYEFYDVVVFYQIEVNNTETAENPAKYYHSWNAFVRSMPFIGSTVENNVDTTGWIMLIKRMVGLPGDTVELKSEEVDGVNRIFLYRNGEKIEEDFIMIDKDKLTPETLTFAQAMAEEGKTIHPIRAVEPVTLGDNEYYMIGDNRSGSTDCRFFGPAKGDTIVGKVRK